MSLSRKKKEQPRVMRPKLVPYRKPETNERRVFNIRMLTIRWGLPIEDVMRLLEKHRPQVFGLSSKVNYDKSVDETNVMIYAEDAYSIEIKEKLPHKKIKAKLILLPSIRQGKQ